MSGRRRCCCDPSYDIARYADSGSPPARSWKKLSPNRVSLTNVRLVGDEYYYADADTTDIRKLSTSGSTVQAYSFGSRVFTADSSGNLFVHNPTSYTNRLVKFNSSGTFQWQSAASFSFSGSAREKIDHSGGYTVLALGSGCALIDSSGSTLFTKTAIAAKIGLFDIAMDCVSVDSSGNTYFGHQTDNNGHMMHSFDNTGTLRWEYTGTTSVTLSRYSLGDGNNYIRTSNTSYEKVDSSGTQSYAFTTSDIWGVFAVDASDDWYLARKSTANEDFAKYDSSGAEQWSTSESADYSPSTIGAIDTNSTGSIWLSGLRP